MEIDNFERQLIHNIVDGGDWNGVLSLRSKGYGWDIIRGRDGRSALAHAIFNSKVSGVRSLLGAGAPIGVDIFGKVSFNPLHAALLRGNADIVELLLEAGCDPCGETDGVSPLACAAESLDGDCTVLLCQHGADPNRASSKAVFGQWLNHCLPAAGGNTLTDADVVIALLEAGAQASLSEGQAVERIQGHVSAADAPDLAEILRLISTNQARAASRGVGAQDPAPEI